ncbi:hypothetical protein GCM10010971_01440 [Silvimonas amylolytica]|uniref:Uncharacterized protein n=1 Tax=Silvimonas amylolytica TaxID=449663 RepID=A0ABQ2PGC6_9NEIS|nr:hypothetical protein GCM10010971_01440 [Silvimonas amylolytica]
MEHGLIAKPLDEIYGREVSRGSRANENGGMRVLRHKNDVFAGWAVCPLRGIAASHYNDWPA